MQTKEYRDVNAVNASSLSYLDPSQGGHPSKYKDYIDGKIDKKETPSMQNGTLLHLFLLKAQDIVVQNVDLPTGMMLSFANYLATEGKKLFEKGSIDHDIESYDNIFEFANSECIDILKAHKLWDKACEAAGYKKSPASYFTEEVQKYILFAMHSVGKVAVTPRDKEILEKCKESLSSHPVAGEMIRMFNKSQGDHISDVRELEIFFSYKVGEDKYINCKGVSDQIKVDHDKKTVQITELKTGYGYPREFFYEFRNRRIYRQLAMYTIGFDKLNPEYAEGYSFHYRIIYQQTSEPFLTKIFDVSPEWIDKGIEELDELLLEVYTRTKNDDWEDNLPDNPFIDFTQEDEDWHKERIRRAFGSVNQIS